MASNYTPQGTYRDIQVISPTNVINVQVDTGYTLPSNIYFEVMIPLEAWQAGSGPEYMTTTAAGLEQLMQEGGVSAVYWTRELDNNGLQADYAVATVSIPTPPGRIGPFRTEVTFTLGILASDPAIYNAVVVPQIEAAIAQLNHDAGLA